MWPRSSGRAAGYKLTLGQVLALGALHGPAELLPISSSGHLVAIPWLLDWSYQDLDPGLKKSFEVALHGGTAAAMAIVLRKDLRRAMRGFNRHGLTLLGISSGPPALVGYGLQAQIERRLGGPRAVATALLGGGIAMALADGAPQTRAREQEGAWDALLLGLAQAGALAPGVSRSGATLTIARIRRFTRKDAELLSRQAALPVISGAALLKGLELRRQRPEPRTSALFAVGAGASFASTLISNRLIAPAERGRPLLPYALYRAALALAMLGRLRRGSTAHPSRRARA